MKDIQDFDSIMIRLASPEQIKAWSYGEVKKPETINYRTLRPERDGLFCEKIFGTTKEWECYCGKFKSIRYKGVICDRCGVEVTNTKVRRERMGHITLAAPVSHIWYYRSVPSRMSMLLDISRSSLQSVLYYEKYVVINKGDTTLKDKQILSEEDYQKYIDQFGEDSFEAEMGAEAIRKLLSQLDLEELSRKLRKQMREKEDKIDKRLLKRIEVVENFRDSGNKPEWMILSVIPVIPPDLRPMVQLDGGRFATSDLNDLYRRVINRNNRLDRLVKLNAPDIIIRNEKRMLQEAVDALFDNSKRKKVVKGASSRPLKSLSDMLKGKQGRFRQNLLGKRVDYSGRSVIVVGPELRMHQCGLPSKMALELYKPFLMKKLVQDGVVYNIKKAKSLVEEETEAVWSILDDVVKEHPVMLNRAPTLHRLGIQAFEPVLVDGKAIKLHPLVCHAFNADFDGDQMAIHVPLTHAAQLECLTLMLSVTNLLDPANGKPIVYPSQDMVLGIFYLTREMKDAKGTGKFFDNIGELEMAIEVGSLSYNAAITYRFPDGKKLKTTAGRVIFNSVLPEGIPFQNQCLGDKDLKKLIGATLKTRENSVTVQMLDSIKDIGYKYATLFGATIGLSDMIVPEEKKALVSSAEGEQQKILDQYRQGHITQEERYNRVIDVWTQTNNKLSNVLMQELEKSQNGFNPLFLMADSGARGSKTQISQLGGMRGLMAKPNGDVIEFPIKSNFKEGLSIIEFFISTNGARKGLSDTALKTSEAGYLTRRLVDISQDLVVTMDDCHTINGIERSAIKDDTGEIIESLADRIVGRCPVEDVHHPFTHKVIAPANVEISDAKAKEIQEAGVEMVLLRTVLTCEAKHGVCRKCYGRNLATNRSVDIGEAVGIVAAQSIGQPGTQLTLRTFHSGGSASTSAEENKLFFKFPVVIGSISGSRVERQSDKVNVFTRKGHIECFRVNFELTKGSFEKLLVADGTAVGKGSPLYVKDGKEFESPANGSIKCQSNRVLLLDHPTQQVVKAGSELLVSEGQYVNSGSPIVAYDPFSEPIITEEGGFTHFVDIKLGTTLIEEVNPETGNVENRITEHALERLSPTIQITSEKGGKGDVLASYQLPGNSYLQLGDNIQVSKGEVLAKMLKEGVKTSDITGGLPRIGELFEARRPKNIAVLAQVSGNVSIGATVKGKRCIIVTDSFGHEYKHLVPMGKNLLVRDGDSVEAADLLCDGSVDPHDILDILGENALQAFLVDEVQQVYRMQGVDINDKHLGVIVRQMLRKVEVFHVGDTNLIQGQRVDKYKFFDENQRVISEGGEPAVARPLLLGITNASLAIDSFISAASFQETTRVLTSAAIAGSKDDLRGLKENVIIGHLIPAGTGMKIYRDIKLKDEELLTQRKKPEEVKHERKEEPEDDDFDVEDIADMKAVSDVVDVDDSVDEE
ncbi:MAG: DNA-directed RNA polymerase subunit beta' [Sphaerochaetaceae bacterium]